MWLNPLHTQIYTRIRTRSTQSGIQSLRVAIQWFIVLDIELAVRAGAHVRYRRARLPSRQPLVEFPQPTSVEVLCMVNPGTSNSVSPPLCLALLMLSISRRKKWRYPLRIAFILQHIQCGVCITSTVDLQHYF